MAERQFTIVNDEPEAPEQTRSASLLFLALKALSQRAVVALADLFCLLTVASVFVLWFVSPSDPTQNQIVSLTIYGLIVLAANWIVRSKR